MASLLAVAVLLSGREGKNARESESQNDGNAGTAAVLNTSTPDTTSTTLLIPIYDPIPDFKPYKSATLGFAAEIPLTYTLRTEAADDNGSWAQFVDERYLSSEVQFPDIVVTKRSLQEGQTFEEALDELQYPPSSLTAINTTTGLVGKRTTDGISDQFFLPTNGGLYVIDVSHFERSDAFTIGIHFVNTFSIL
jgi:hypothetical protein